MSDDPPISYALAADGVRIAYTSHGDGPTLVALPAVPLSNLVGEWRVPPLREAYEALASRLRLVQYDGRGTGHSQRDVNDLSLDAMLLDLQAVVDDAGLETFALLGFYHSVFQAIAYAARHPGPVTHVVLFGGSARGWNAMSPPETQALLSLIERDWDVFVESAAHAWLGWSQGESGRLASESFRTATTPDVARAILREASAIDVTDDLARVVAPSLVLHRQGPRQIPLEVSAQLADALPNGRLRVLDGSSATLFLEHPEQAIGAIVDFLGGSEPLARPRASQEPTPRELDVLRLLAQGETNAEIARRLGLSVHTVERHLVNLYRKIDARGRADATAYAVRRGLA